MPRPKRTKPKESTNTYSISLSVNGKEYKGDGETFEEAITKINVDKFTSKGIMNITKNGRNARILMNIIQMRKVFGNVSSTTKKIFVGFFNNKADQLLK